MIIWNLKFWLWRIEVAIEQPLKGQSRRKRMNRARIAHRFSFLRGACVICVICQLNELGTVSDCEWMCLEGGLCVILSFERFKIFPTHVGVRNSWVGMHSLCVEYVWLCAGHASAVSAYASELVRNRIRPRPSTDAPRSYHAWTAHVLRNFHWQLLTKLERSRSVRV
jgi:hypothetical protein